jgi:myo-inositol 2-dehydrogenase/D-chiro-inositol 1-dehydrogenase
MSKPRVAHGHPDQPAFTGCSRRQFSAAAAVTAAMVADPLARTAHAAGSDRLKVGLVGCGGRGTGAGSQALQADPGMVLWALADPFPDRVESGFNILARVAADRAKEDSGIKDRLDCPTERRFTGLDGYKSLIDCCDVVLLATPTAFRHLHLRAAVEAGKHVFCEKPVASDAAQLRHVRDTVEMFREKKLSLVGGLCWRYDNRMRDVFKRLADGAIGPVRSAYTTYNSGGWRGEIARKPEWTDMEYQIRNWQYYTWLSGDHITEQAIHSLDRLLWAFGDEMPVAVSCTGGRQLRGDRPVANNVFDHFCAAFDWADGRRGFHTCRHFPGAASDNTDYVTGTTGTGLINGFGNKHQLTTPAGSWQSEAPKNAMYQQEHDDLFASIRGGTPINDGSVLINSNVLALMARMSAYSGQPISTAQFWAAKESLLPQPLTLETPVPATPVAVPGKTTFA